MRERKKSNLASNYHKGQKKGTKQHTSQLWKSLQPQKMVLKRFFEQYYSYLTTGLFLQNYVQFVVKESPSGTTETTARAIILKLHH